MIPVPELTLFFVMVFGIVLVPGLDMAFVLSSALIGGRRSGLVAVAGIVAGGLCHVVGGTLGVGAILRGAPAAFNLLLLVGSAYVAWLGVGLLRARAAALGEEASGSRSLAATFRRGAFTNLLNPKAYLFTLAVFPQFLRPERGSLIPQAMALAVVIALTQATVYGGVALAAGRLQPWLEARPGAMLRMSRAVGCLLVLVALWTALEGWRRLT